MKKGEESEEKISSAKKKTSGRSLKDRHEVEEEYGEMG